MKTQAFVTTGSTLQLWHTSPGRICWSCRTAFDYYRASRNYSTDKAPTSAPPPSGNSSTPSSSSIFASNNSSTWDHLFSNIESFSPSPGSLSSTVPRSPRRQAMTAREIKAFDEMFNMIFDAVSEKRASESAASGANIASNDIAIGGGMSDLFGKLRQHSKRMRWSTEAEEILDKKRESMDLCQTDRELLDWAAREVFQASISYEEEAREAMRDMATATHAKAKAAAQVNSNTSNVKSADSPSTQPQASQTPQQFGLPVLQSPAYPHLIALLIQTFRDKYQDPNLALAIFEHAKTLSIASYVFGCTTIVYNQVLKTRWGYFADLKGVHDALAEMKVNGIEADSKTRKIVDGIRRDIGQKGELWIGEIDVAAGVMNDVWSILSRIEELAKPLEHKKVPNRRRQMLKWDDWKSMPLEDDETDRWGFNQWRKPDASLQSAFKADHAQR